MLTTVTVHGEILAPITNVPATGTVTFNTMIELRDIVDNVVYAPMAFVATLDVNGEFTIVLPATDNADLVPASWVYQVYINTDILNDVQYVQIPFAPGVTEFADLEPLDYDPCSGVLAGTPVVPSDSGLFVRKTGDTMSGNLIINANLQVSGDTNVGGSLTAQYQGISGDVMQLLATALSTNVASGGELSLNADPTKIDIAPMTGWIISYNSTNAAIGPTNPLITYITYAGTTGLTPSFAPLTHYLINSAGTLIQQNTRPTPAQRRTHIVLGTSLTQLGVVIIDQTIPVIASQVNNQLCDLMDSAGPFSTQGNVISSNGVNLTFRKTSGTIFTRGFNQIPDFLNPHNSSMAAQAPVNFRHITALVGSASPLTTILNVSQYDPGGTGVLTPVGGGANSSTSFRVWGFANNTVNEQILVQYGQNTYASLSAAVAGLRSGNYIPQPVTSTGALLGWISVTRTATNLSDPTQAVFTKASKFDIP